MSPAAPPPPPPTNPIVFHRLQAQSESRKARLAQHKATVMAFSVQVEDLDSDTPVEATRLPSPAELCTPANLEDSGEMPGMATRVLDPENGLEHDPIADGFAALRAQSAQRKVKLRELKRTAAHCTYAQARTKIMPQGARKLREEMKDTADELVVAPADES